MNAKKTIAERMAQECTHKRPMTKGGYYCQFAHDIMISCFGHTGNELCSGTECAIIKSRVKDFLETNKHI